jgi:predicted DNA binding CopG/RHH family protein
MDGATRASSRQSSEAENNRRSQKRGVSNGCPKKKLIVPESTSEAEDAKWHERNRRALESAMERRIIEGSTLTLPQAAARMKTRPVTLRLAATDIDTARAIAAQKGIGYQTYVKMLLHEALRREAGKQRALASG